MNTCILPTHNTLGWLIHRGGLQTLNDIIRRTSFVGGAVSEPNKNKRVRRVWSVFRTARGLGAPSQRVFFQRGIFGLA